MSQSETSQLSPEEEEHVSQWGRATEFSGHAAACFWNRQAEAI